MVSERGRSTPVPDPTELTTDQLHREIDSLKEIIFTRLAGMDRATQLLSESADRVPTDIDRSVTHLRELIFQRFETVLEKFSSVQKQFDERDVRTEQTSRDSKVAVDAALQAAKEAVGEQNKSSALAIAKSEAATTKQIDQQAVLISTSNAGLDSKITDVKERLTRIEGEKRGSAQATQTTQLGNSSMVGLISLVLGSLIGLGGLVLTLMRVPH